MHNEELETNKLQPLAKYRVGYWRKPQCTNSLTFATLAQGWRNNGTDWDVGWHRRLHVLSILTLKAL